MKFFYSDLQNNEDKFSFLVYDNEEQQLVNKTCI